MTKQSIVAGVCASAVSLVCDESHARSCAGSARRRTCHEGNYGMQNSLNAARKAEADAAARK